MIEFHKKEIGDIQEIVMISNTPAFLYKRIRKIDFIYELSKKHSSKELFNEVKTICDKDNREDIDLLKTYYLIISLSSKDDFNFKCLDNINLSWVGWINDLKSIINMNQKHNNISQVQSSLLDYSKPIHQPSNATYSQSIKDTNPINVKVFS